MKSNPIDNHLSKLSPNYLGAYLGADIQLYNLLEWVLLQTNAANITVITFSMNEIFIRKIYQLKKANLIKNITVILDSKAIQKTRKLASFAANVFSEMYFSKTHAKIILIENDNHQIAIVGSQNFTRGNREESGLITNTPDTVAIYKNEIERIRKNAIQFKNQTDIKFEVIKTKSKDRRQNFSFSNCNHMIKTHGLEYFALFRNIKMDLEYLKSKPEHVDMFIIPLMKYIKANNVKQIVYAPAGARTAKNGFHFVTELLQKTKQYIDFEMINAFVNRNNHIYIKPNQTIDPNAYLFDDIVTRGTTLLKMVELTGIQNRVILICNH